MYKKDGMYFVKKNVIAGYYLLNLVEDLFDYFSNRCIKSRKCVVFFLDVSDYCLEISHGLIVNQFNIYLKCFFRLKYNMLFEDKV